MSQNSCESNAIYQLLKKGVIAIGEHLLAMQNSSNLESSQKENIHSIVTIADKEAEERLIALIKNNFPKNAILSEELHSENHADTFWVIDPIDGTSFFEHGLHDWTITLAFVEDKKIQFGLTYCPYTKELFFAQAGNGAFLNGRRIYVSKRNALETSIISLGHRFIWIEPNINTSLIKNVRALWMTGSTAFVLANIAAGRLEAMVQRRQSFWDIAAGIILIQEAGGKITNWQDGEEFDMTGAYSEQNNIVASNGALHNILLEEVCKER